MLLILQMINDRGGHVDKVDFARRLYNWMRFGFKELGDLGIYDSTPIISCLVVPVHCLSFPGRWYGNWYDCASHADSSRIPEGSP